MSLLAALALVLVTVGWAALPLLPAIRELLHPTDVEPLTTVGRDNADISRFARHFREYVGANLRQLPAEAAEGDYFGRFTDGTHFMRVAHRPDALSRPALADGSSDRLVILEQPVELPGQERFRLEVWAKAKLGGGSGATYRGLLGEDAIRLGAGSTVLRWVHSAGELDVGDGCVLYGRTSSERAIRLGRGVRFERAGAPVIRTGAGEPSEHPPATPDLVPCQFPEGARRLGDHLRVETDWFIPPHTEVTGSLVVAGRLQIGAGSRVRGSVKAHGAIEVDRGVVIEGSLVSRNQIRIRGGSAVGGPVIAEEDIELGNGTSVGSRTKPTTVTGRRVHLVLGSAVFGHIVTREGAETLV